MIQDCGGKKQDSGQMVVALFVGIAIGGSLVWLADILGKRRPIVACCVLCSACMLSIAFCTTSWALWILQFLIGLLSGLAFPLGPALCNDMVSEEHLWKTTIWSALNYDLGSYSTSLALYICDPRMTGEHWRRIYLGIGLVLLIISLATTLLYESPTFLVQKHEIERVISCLLNFGGKLQRSDLLFWRVASRRQSQALALNGDSDGSSLDLEDSLEATPEDSDVPTKRQQLLTDAACLFSHIAANLFIHAGFYSVNRMLPVMTLALSPATVLTMATVFQGLGVPAAMILLARFPTKVAHMIVANCGGWCTLLLLISGRYGISWLFVLSTCGMTLLLEVSFTTIFQLSLECYPAEKVGQMLSIHCFVGRLSPCVLLFILTQVEHDAMESAELSLAIIACCLAFNFVILLPARVKCTTSIARHQMSPQPSWMLTAPISRQSSAMMVRQFSPKSPRPMSPRLRSPRPRSPRPTSSSLQTTPRMVKQGSDSIRSLKSKT